VHLSVSLCVWYLINTLSFKSVGLIFVTTLSELVHFAKMNASSFEVKRSKVNITASPRAQRADAYRARYCALTSSFYCQSFIQLYLECVLVCHTVSQCVLNVLVFSFSL